MKKQHKKSRIRMTKVEKKLLLTNKFKIYRKTLQIMIKFGVRKVCMMRVRILIRNIMLNVLKSFLGQMSERNLKR